MYLFEDKLDLCSINCGILVMTGNCSESFEVLATSPWVVSAMRGNPPSGANSFKGVLKVYLS